MRRTPLFILCLLSAACTLAAGTTAKLPYTAGYERVHIGTPERPLQLDVWYPATAEEAPHRYGLSAGTVANGAAPVPGRHPLVLFSPGAFGSASNYSWVEERLARDGYVVVGVSDFGEAYDYGPETVDRRMAGRFDLRVQDMRNALAFATSDAHWSALTDKANVTLIGHSSGGATAALSVGAIFVGEDFRSWCRTPESKGDLGCNYIAGVPESYKLPSFGPWKIRRISRIVLMDPAAGPAMTDASLGAVHIPALVIGARHDDFLPYDAHAGKYLRALGEATGYPLTDTSGHFIFLDECDADIDVFGVSLCKDRAGTDRQVAHEKIYAAIREFLER